jgi:hypothetical protein
MHADDAAADKQDDVNIRQHLLLDISTSAILSSNHPDNNETGNLVVAFTNKLPPALQKLERKYDQLLNRTPTSWVHFTYLDLGGNVAFGVWFETALRNLLC